MNLYESLVSNVGIGKDVINKQFLQKLRDEMCDNFKGFMLRFFTKTNFVKVHQMLAKSLGLPNDRTAYVGSRFRDQCQTILKWCIRKPDGQSTHVAVFAVDNENFYVIDGVEDFKRVYEKLDKAFKKYYITDTNTLTEMTYRIAPSFITTVNLRMYNIKDARGLLEELL